MFGFKLLTDAVPSLGASPLIIDLWWLTRESTSTAALILTDSDSDIDSVVQVSLFKLRLLAKMKPFLTQKDLEKAMHATSLLFYISFTGSQFILELNS